MNCAESRELIHANQGDELEERLQGETEAHLSACPDCRREAAHLLASLSGLRAAFPEQTPPATLREKILGWARTQ